MNIPQQINYTGVKPKGFPTQFKQWEVVSNTNFGSTYNKDEQIRLNFSTEYLIDPYQSYIEIEVSLNETEFQWIDFDLAPFLLLDGNSTSLIENFTLYSNGREIERISEYDQIGNILEELCVLPETLQTKQYQGRRLQSIYQNNSLTQPRSQQVYLNTSLLTRQYILRSDYNPFSNQMYLPPSLTSEYVQDLRYFALLLQSFTSPSLFEKFLLSDTKLHAVDGSYHKHRGNYLLSSLASDATYGIEHAYKQVKSDFVDVSQFASNSGAVIVTANDVGYRKPFSYSSNLGQSDILCPYVPASTMKDGRYNNDAFQNPFDTTNFTSMKTQSGNYRSVKRKYIVPIISGVIGSLIPQSEKKLIPGAGLGEMAFEFRINKNAFYCSTCKNGEKESYDVAKMWEITKFSIHFDLWKFDEQIMKQINQNLEEKGVIISSQSFTLSSIQQVPDTSSLSNSWQINNVIPSLKTVFFWFLSRQYEKKTYCRKHFRCSGNLTSIQLRIGDYYLPNQPIEGKAGNPIQFNDDRLDNQEFVIELHKVVGSFLNTNKHCNIGPGNFAINERCYDINLLDHVYKNVAAFHEQRGQGLAIYAISTESNPQDQNILSGLDTTVKRPIDLVITSESNNDPKIPLSLHILLHYDIIVQLSRTRGAQVFGR